MIAQASLPLPAPLPLLLLCSLPLPMKEVYELYKPVVKEGSWTFGLLEM